MAAFSTASLARSSARHPWRVIIGWIVALAIAGGIATTLGNALTTSTNFSGKPESQKGADLIEQRLRPKRPVTETVILTSSDLTVTDDSFKQAVEATANDLRAMSGILVVGPTYYEAAQAAPEQAKALVSKDQHATLLTVTFKEEIADAEKHTDEYLAAIAKHDTSQIHAYTVGDVSANHEFTQISDEDLSKSERYSLPLTIIILIVIFGALVAAGVPLILALVAIVTALGLTAIVGRFTDLSFYVVNMIIMIGTAVGIDYTLFIVERYREERRHGLPKQDAIVVAGGTASKAVLFSGITVFLALMGMFLVPLTVFHSLGAGAVLAVISAVAAMLTLVPAILSLLGDRIDWPRRRRYDEHVADQRLRDAETYHRGFWGTVTKIVTGRPAIFVVAGTLLLVVCALPYFDIVRGSAGIETLPPSDLKTAYTILRNDFSVGVISPVEIAIDGKPSDPATQSVIQKLTAAIGQDSEFGPVTETDNTSGADNLAMLSTPLNLDPSSEEAVDAVKRLRDRIVPPAVDGADVQVYVTGAPGFNADYFKTVDDSTPIVFAFVLGLSFILLLLAFRSIVVPIKAIIMNLLSVGAAYGLLVLVFQKGYGHSWFGFQKVPTIEAWVPTFLFCVLFGLSMDYHVFLLSRIREHYDATHDNRVSVASGLQSTARIITGAALIMVIVFAGFASGKLVAFQQMGFGLAVAVFLDATLVRSVLVPSAMTLLGDANWYLPSWLRWLPDLRIENADAHVGGASAPAPAD
jgi:RND superfamily putative drug exporter